MRGVGPPLAWTALLVGALGGCAHASPAASPVAAEAPRAKNEGPRPTVETILPGGPDLLVTVHPPALARDAVYGPLVRRASELASAFAGPTSLGTTALAVLERTDEIVVAAQNHGKDSLVILRGVPADVDPLEVVDTAGKPVWKNVEGDMRTGSRELAPADGPPAALFVTPSREWVIASGVAIASARAAVIGGLRPTDLPGDETALVSVALPGDALPQLRQGSLAPVGAGLLKVLLELSPGAAGLVVAKLTYTDAVAAASAEGTVLAVTLAFRHRLEERAALRDAPPKTPPPDDARPGKNLDWLGAAKVDRDGRTVIVRAPIPRPWLAALARADLPVPRPERRGARERVGAWSGAWSAALRGASRT